jgi:hypothetical protein
MTMHIESLIFGRDALTPVAHAAGIVIHASPGPNAQRVVIRGACKIANADAPLAGALAPHGVFLTAIEALEQRPFTIPLVGQRLVFPEDVTVLNDDLLFEFCAMLDASRAMTGPYYLHASFFEHVSNVLHVPFTPEDPK